MPEQLLSIVPYGSRLFFLAGEVDMTTAPDLALALAPAVEEGGPITLEMTGVTFLDSTGIHALAHALHSLPTGCLVLHGVGPAVRRVLSITGLDRFENLHVNPCVRDPYPVVDRNRSPRSAELAERLTAMRDAFQRAERTSGRARATAEQACARALELLEHNRRRRAAA